jgi:hypothetical protein
MTREERRWCLVYAAILAAITSLPYLLGYGFQGEAWRFSGFVFGVEDGNSYIAKMLLGVNGDWLFRTPYSTMPQRGVLAFLPYLLLGKLAAGAGLHEQLVALFHLFRVLAIPAGVLAVYQFSTLFLPSEYWRRWTTILTTLGGGLGWMLVMLGASDWLGSLPLDFYSPETFGFLAFYGLPHLILARALLIFGLINYLHADASPRRGWISGLCFLLLGLVQPLSLIAGGAVIAVHQLVILIAALRAKNIRDWMPWFGAACRVGIVVLPLVSYLAFAFTGDAFLRAWTSQNRILSPHPLHYLIAYGLFLPFVFIGARMLIVREDKRGMLLVGWAVALPFLAYAPHNLQRRLPEGVWVALVLMAAVGINAVKSSSLRTWIRRGLVVLALPSSFLLLAGGIGTAIRLQEPVFRPTQEVEAFEWLGDEAAPGSVVLAAYSTGNALPAWAPVRVVVGHGPESADLEQLLPAVERFYTEMSEMERSAFLNAYSIDYLWMGPRERALGHGGPIDYELLYDQKGQEIYRVSP